MKKGLFVKINKTTMKKLLLPVLLLHGLILSGANCYNSPVNSDKYSSSVTESFFMLNDTSHSAPLVFLAGTKGKYNFNDDSVKIYPNPNSGQFVLDFVNPVNNDNSEIIITDLTGRQVYKGPVSREELTKQFDLSEIKSGMYIVMIRDKDILVTKKFIKK